MADKLRLLVSVRDDREASVAAEARVDIIDVKEPSRGALGRADGAVVSKIVAAVAGRAPVTMALGELTQWIDGETAEIPAGVSFVKMGLAHAPADWRTRLPARDLGPSMPGVVAVAYADRERVGAPTIREVLTWGVENQAAGLLVDTAIKDGRGLFDWATREELAEAISIAHRARLFVALAGSLGGDSLLAAAALKPDIVAVRGAACAGRDRGASIDAGAIAQLKHAIQSVN